LTKRNWLLFVRERVLVFSPWIKPILSSTVPAPELARHCRRVPLAPPEVEFRRR